MKGIEVKNLTKKYKDVVAVDNLNLSILEGELFALLGVNGAGKTTVIKMLCCLLKPTDGEGFLLGKSIVDDPISVKELIGISPQETAIASSLTVYENLALICGIYGFNQEKTERRIAELTEKFHLLSVLRKKAGKLSGGWQRRLSIALALIGEPKILFLDEPTLGLDVIARSELWEVIRALKGEITILLTTHYLEEAEALADRVGVMKEGKLIALGSAEELKKQTKKERFDEAFISLVREAEV